MITRNPPLVLARFIARSENALLVFMNKEGGVVRIFLKDGKILKVDGSFGEGKTELSRIFLWEEAQVVVKPLPQDVSNQEGFTVNGILKLLVEGIRRKEIDKQKHDTFENILAKLGEPDLEYDPEEWIGFRRLVESLGRNLKYAVIEIYDANGTRYIAFLKDGNVELALSRDKVVDVDSIDTENLFKPFGYKVHILDANEYMKVRNR